MWSQGTHIQGSKLTRARASTGPVWEQLVLVDYSTNIRGLCGSRCPLGLAQDKSQRPQCWGCLLHRAPALPCSSRYCGAAALKVSHPASRALRFCDEDLAFKWLLFYFQGNIFCFFSLSISYLKMSETISKEKYNLFFLSLSLCIHGQRTNFLGILFLYRLGLLVHLFSQFCRTVLGIQGQMILSNQQKWDKRDNPIQH